jgi:predicted nuclease with RNAse H fold
MRTVGVDLAAEPPSTAVATIEWGPGSARVSALQVGVDDDAVLAFADNAEKVGIDCPLGWPDTFVRFLRNHHEGSSAEIPQIAGSMWRRSLAYRVTDERVRAQLEVIPLSVAADRIALTAMRAARLQAMLAQAGHRVDRVGAGLIVEVYPAAGLKYWGLSHRQYKGTKNLEALGKLVDDLPQWLDLGGYEAECRRSDHAIDAVVAALLARANALGLTTQPTAGELAAAVREGWIAVPTCSLDDLVSQQDVLQFEDKDGDYLAWQAANPDLFVINAERSLNPRNLVLHQASCRTISGAPSRGTQWTGPYIKICGSRAELEKFAHAKGGTARPCGLCL